MKLSIVLAATGVALAMAGPLNKRVMETTVVYDYMTVTVTAGHSGDATCIPDNNGRVGRGRHRSRTRSQVASSIPTPDVSTAQPDSPSTPSPIYTPIETTVVPQPKSQPVATTTTPPPEPEPATTVAPSQPAPTGGTGNALIDIFVNSHNVHRANHSAPAVEWDDALASAAQQLADTCVFAHDTSLGGGGYGQNLASQGSTADIANDDPSTYAATAVHDQWYNGEIGAYAGLYGSEPDISGLHAWGHFSQLVWLGSTKIGCAVKYCEKGTMNSGFNNWYTVCNYGPAGNVISQFAANVLAPLGEATVS